MVDATRRLHLKAVVLDAMGVIYFVGDDVADLLCPFIAEKGGTSDITKIERLYHSATLGNMSAFEFWKSVGIEPGLEDEYLQRYKLTDGLIEFLEAMNSRDIEVWCLSNDISEWSRKLRARFGLERYFQGFVISSDVGARKPDHAIFEYLLGWLSVSPSDAVFVDDQPKNLNPAAQLGFGTILFAPCGANANEFGHDLVRDLSELLSRLS